MPRIAQPLTAILAVLVALMSFRFLALGLEPAFSVMRDHILNRETMFLIHVTLAPVALFLGPFQFMPRLRARRKTLHRWMGRVYALACILGGVAGLDMAINAIGGPVAGWGFGLLSVLWIGTTINAVRLAMQGDIANHRRWMIRSFALTFAAVTLRLQLPFLIGSGMDYPAASLIVAWSCWIPNALFAEWWITRRAVLRTA
jgi:uncharacterized membrane protein